jgi:hypothetical protein
MNVAHTEWAKKASDAVVSGPLDSYSANRLGQMLWGVYCHFGSDHALLGEHVSSIKDKPYNRRDKIRMLTLFNAMDADTPLRASLFAQASPPPPFFYGLKEAECSPQSTTIDNELLFVPGYD